MIFRKRKLHLIDFQLTNSGVYRGSIPPWEAALAKLSADDKQAMTINSGVDKLTILTQVLEATKKKRDICREKQWKFTWNGETVILRDVADKLLVSVDKFKAIGDFVVSCDSTHAALPWAGFQFLLKVNLLFPVSVCSEGKNVF